LSFLALENKISNDHVEIMWQAAQLKHCSKQVFDILSSLICNMEPGPVIHLHNLLKKLEPKDHTEQVFMDTTSASSYFNKIACKAKLKLIMVLKSQSLYLASALLKFIWSNAAVALEEQHLNATGSSSIKSRGRSRTRARVVDVSSSENSVSVEASHSEDEGPVSRKI
jgi:ubiquitin carboxyl-terminal hydrolase 34